MKKILIALLLVPTVAWADTSTTYVYVPPSNGASVNEIIAAVKKVPELEKRIEELEKRVNNLPRVTLPDDTHSWTLTPN